MKKHRKPRFYAILMALQPAVFVLSVLLGGWLDSIWWKGFYDRPHPPGHPGPFFSALVPAFFLLLTLVVFLVMLVGLIRALRRQRAERTKGEKENRA